jgi:hypothetical protein
MVVKTHPAVGLVPPSRGRADVMQQRCLAQHQIRAVIFQRDGLPQLREGTLVDVLVLVVFVDFEPNAQGLQRFGMAHDAWEAPCTMTDPILTVATLAEDANCYRLRHGCSASIVVTNSMTSASVSSSRLASCSVAAAIRCRKAP